MGGIGIFEGEVGGDRVFREEVSGSWGKSWR